MYLSPVYAAKVPPYVLIKTFAFRQTGMASSPPKFDFVNSDDILERRTEFFIHSIYSTPKKQHYVSELKRKSIAHGQKIWVHKLVMLVMLVIL